VDILEFRPRQRRTYLIWAGASTCVVLLAALGVAIAPHVPGGWTGLLFLPGGVALVLAPITFNGAIGRTVLSDRGILTGGIVRRRARWSEVSGIDTEGVQGRSDHGTRVRIRLKSGTSFSLAAPLDMPDGQDPEFASKVGRIEAYWYARRNHTV